MRRSLFSSVLVGLLVATLASCGGDSDGDSPTTVALSTTLAPTTAAPTTGMIPIGRSTGTMMSGGLEREFELHVPTGYDGTVAMPLVVVFHGYTMTAGDQASESDLPALADEQGFIVVFPQGRGDVQRWLFELDAVDIDISASNPDVAFASDLLDVLTTDLNVDTDRVYAVGFSNGGWMASAVACTLSERFAAAAPVAGIMDFGAACAPTNPVPLVTFHGTSDRYEPFEGGTQNAPFRGDLPTDLGGTLDELPVSDNPILDLGVPEKVALWAARNGCGADPTLSPAGDGVGLWEYACPTDDPVRFYEIAAGTHYWDIVSGFDTNANLWSFLSLQTR